MSSDRVGPVSAAAGAAREAVEMRATQATARLRTLLAVPLAQLAAAIAELTTDERHLRLGDTNVVLMDPALSAATRAHVQHVHDELLRAIAAE